MADFRRKRAVALLYRHELETRQTDPPLQSRLEAMRSRDLLYRKSREIAENPRAALAFYWREISRQVRVVGRSVDGVDVDLVRTCPCGT